MTLRAEYIKATTSLITTAFALAAGLAWNNTILALFKLVLGSSDDLAANLLYSIIITAIAVTAIIILARMASKIAGEEIKAKIA
jgi:hypothetical protein